MGLFSRKNNKEEVKPKVDAKVAKTKAVVVKKAPKATGPKVISDSLNLLAIVKRPRISEKAAVVGENANAYVFDVMRDATKPQISEAIQKIYKVVPIKINIAQVPSKKVQIRGRRGKTGVKSGGKKAFVFLKKGDKIELI